MRRLHLIESAYTARRGGVHSFVSFSAHLAIVAAALYATTRPAVAREDDLPDPRIHFVPETPRSPAPVVRERLRSPERTPDKAGPPVLRPPVEYPVDPNVRLPAPDIRLPEPSLPSPGAGQGPDKPAAGADVRGSGRAEPYEAGEVEIPAAPLSRTGPSYPERALRLAMSGSVTVRFVVSAEGRVEHDVHILETTGPDFTSAVQSFLRRARYRPAHVGGQPVRQMVEQRFVFELRR